MKKINLFFILLFSLLVLPFSFATDLNITIYNNDNSTAIALYNWDCSITNSTGTVYEFIATAGNYDGVVNASYYDILCINGTTSDKQYRLYLDDFNVTTDVELNLSMTLFNISENHTTGTTYPSNQDIGYVFNATQSGIFNTTPTVTIKNYITDGTLASGSSTQTNQYNFNSSQSHSTTVGLDLTSSGFGTLYLDMGIFDGDLLMWSDSKGHSGATSEYLYRRETIIITDSTTSLIEHDLIEGLPTMGSDLGDFLGNLVPGIGKFILILGLFVGIVAIIYGLVSVIVLFVKKNGK